MNIKYVPPVCTIFLWTVTFMLPVCTIGYQYGVYPDQIPIPDDDIEYKTVKRNDGLNLSLCPEGVNKLRCIHSYLSYYARGRLTDPVAQRNIGKRNMPFDKKGVLMCPPNMDKFQCYDNAIEYYIRVMKMMST